MSINKKEYKKIEFEGKQLLYRTFTYDAGDCGYRQETNFYDIIKTEEYKKYRFFGKTLERPLYLFKVYFALDTLDYTTSQVQAKIRYQLSLLERKKDVQNGILI